MFYSSIQVGYETLKSIVLSRKLSVQFIQVDDVIYLMAIDGPFSVSCMLNQSNNEAWQDFETTLKPFGNKSPNSVAISSQAAALPFAAKTLAEKKLYKRVTGLRYDLVAGDQDLFHTINFPWAKITGIEVIGGENGDTCCFYILDTPTGQFSTIPNHALNQFAFDVNISDKFYTSTSEFDADLFQNMRIKVKYHSVGAKKIGVNFILNEVK
jgi:hypothetical protein